MIKERINKNRIVKDILIRDIRTLVEEQEDYYKPKRVSNSWNNNYIAFESNSDTNKNLSLGGYLNKIKSYLRDMIIGLQEFDT